MEALFGPVYLAGLLLALGGAAKAVTPIPTAGALRALHIPAPPVAVRALGVAEVVIGLAAVITGAAPLILLVAALYLAFTVFVLVALRSGTTLQTCGCFGMIDTPPSIIHVGLDAACALVCATVAFTGPRSFTDVLADQPLGGVPLIALLIVGLYLAYQLLTALPIVLGATRELARASS